jgi:hypothetical protein
MILLFRLFAPASDPDAAAALGRRLLDALHEFAPAVAQPPERYWKIPEWYEHTIELRPATESVFDTALALASAGWSHIVRDGECSAVWNAEPGSVLLLPEVTWAELLLVYPTDGPDGAGRIGSSLVDPPEP